MLQGCTSALGFVVRAPCVNVMTMQTHSQPWDVETDLLVVGAGAAGMTAALVGALEGLKVVLCEKSDMVGGTTAFSAGSIWIPGSSQSRSAGTPDTTAAARTYLGAILGEHANDARLDFYLRMAPRALDDLEARTSLRFAAPRREFMVLGGMMVGKTDIEPLLHPFRSWSNF